MSLCLYHVPDLTLLYFILIDPAVPANYTLSLHDALPISLSGRRPRRLRHRPAEALRAHPRDRQVRSEEHTSELQSPCNLVCRLLLEKKKHSNHEEHTTT